jgi:hypothetical protein
VDHSAPLNVRRWLALALAALAVAELTVLALLAAGVDRRLRIGPFLIIIHSVRKPLWIGIAAALGVRALAGRSTMLRRLSGLLAVSLVVLTLIVLARTTPSVVTKSDIAVTELYVQLATKGALLEGPYSRFEWHHPGPLYFYMQVPFYALSGQRGAGLYVGALAINLLALAVLAWVLLRIDRGPLAVAILAGWFLFAWRDRFIAASPWTAHVSVLATFTFVVLAAAVVSGRRWMMPALVVFGSFMAQSHVGLVPLVLALSTAALAAVAVTRRDDGPLAPLLNTCGWLLAALWLLPVAEQLSHGRGNLAHLWTFFTTGGSTPSYSAAFAAWSYALVGPLRPDLYLPYGGHVEFTHLAWAIPVALAEVIALAVAGTFARRAGRRFDASMAWTALLASIVSFWSIARIRGDILDHQIFWIVPLGALNLSIVGAAAARPIAARWPGVQATASRAATAICGVLVLAAVQDGLGDLDRLVAYENAMRRKDADINTTYDCIVEYLGAYGVRKPLFKIEQWDTAAAMLVRLNRSNRPFAVEDKSLPIFTDVFAAHGDEDAVIAIAGRAAGADAHGAAVVLQREPVYVEAMRIQR